MQKKIFSLFLIFIFSSCVFSIENKKLKKFKKTKIPAMFSIYSGEKENLEKWWEQFNSKELNLLVEIALKNNFDMQSAVLSIKKAYFVAVKTGGERYPNLSLNASKSRTENSYKNSNKNIVINNYSLGLSTSYEIDLWQRISNLNKSALISLEATKEDLKTIASTVVSQITENWINLISVRKQKELLLKQLEINKKMFEIIDLRLSQSMSNLLDFYQQKQAIASIETSLVPIYAKEKTLLHTLNLLLGRSPKTELNIIQQDFPLIDRTPKIGIPSDLIQNRPDVMSAELKLKAAGYDVAAAKKNRLPKLSLTASYSYSNSNSSKIFDDWISNLILNLTAPLFEGKKLQAEQKRMEAEREAIFTNYKKIVITAIKEVEDALVQEEEYRTKYDAVEKQIQIAEKTLEEAKQRYLNGITEFLSVLETELSLINYKQNQIDISANILTARILLHKALGSKIATNLINIKEK